MAEITGQFKAVTDGAAVAGFLSGSAAAGANAASACAKGGVSINPIAEAEKSK